jgi:hypothetical protein
MRNESLGHRKYETVWPNAAPFLAGSSGSAEKFT